MATSQHVPVETIIAERGEHGFAYHRIPAMTRLEDGTLLVAWDGRPTNQDAPAPNVILQRRSHDLGRSWQPVEVLHAGERGYSDPSYVLDRRSGLLHCFHVASQQAGFFESAPGTDDADPQVLSTNLSTSADGGHTWTHRLVTEQVKPARFHGAFPVSGAGIQLGDGRLVQQFCGREPAGVNPDGQPVWAFRAWSVFSDDGGQAWSAGEPVGDRMDENKVVELGDGTLMLNARDQRAGGVRWVALSTDRGQTWSAPQPEHQLRDPSCNAHIGRLGDGRLVFTHASDPADRRVGLLRVSGDDGRTWDEGTSVEPGEFGYSVVTELEPGVVGVFFERGGQMVFRRLAVPVSPAPGGSRPDRA